MNAALLTIQLRYEQDVVPTRQRARFLANLLGLTGQQQTALATAVSEMARNALSYSGSSARVEYAIRDHANGSLLNVTVEDHGSGIADLQLILDGRYESKTGMGLGIVGSRRLCDEFEIQTVIGKGTKVQMGMYLPKPVTPQQVASVTQQLVQQQPQSSADEMREQNRELLTAMHTLQQRQAEVERLNSELSETNRGVLALYAELDEQAATLKRANDYKTRFLSDMTHELRTPLNAMISLSRILLDRTDGELTTEQDHQIKLIHRSATSLGEMVNDLLDLAKIESGKTDIRAEEFSAQDLFAVLRGTFRPLFAASAVNLTIDDPPQGVTLFGDEAKLSQILRNLVSNAMKFTEAGEVHVSMWVGDQNDVIFVVRDTGIGIAAEHIDLIFQDYSQIDSVIQRRQKGTGLGLPLTKKLVALLGGTISVSSQTGKGSTFTVSLPMRYDPTGQEMAIQHPRPETAA